MPKIDPAILRQQIVNLRETHKRAFSDDGEAWLLSLESETELPEFMDRLIEEMHAAQAMADGAAMAIEKMQERKRRFVARVHALRELARSVLIAAGIPKVERPAATLSLLRARKSLTIDEEAVPPEWRAPGRPDRERIVEALKAGAKFNWASYTDAEDGIAARFR